MVKHFFASLLVRKVLFKVLLASMKTLTNSRYFTGSRIVDLNSSFEKADSQKHRVHTQWRLPISGIHPMGVHAHPLSAYYHNVQSCSVWSIHCREGRYTPSISSLPYMYCTSCPPDILKSNTVTRFKTISGLLNNLQNHRRLPVCRNKHFKEGYWKGFHN